MMSCNRFNLLDMFRTIDHQRNVFPSSRCQGNGCDILLVPCGIADQQVLEAQGGQEDRFLGSIAHDTMKTWIGCQDTANHGNTAQRLGSKPHSFSLSTGHYLANVLLEQVKIEESKRHGATSEDALVIMVIVFALVCRSG